jgi:hypothetical protein
LLPGGEHRLITLDVLGDGIVGERDGVGVLEFGSDQGAGPASTKVLIR